MREGILWGSNKACEFWAIEDLVSENNGGRVIGINGRSCTLVLAKKGEIEYGEDDSDEVGIETQFSLIDAKELPGINS